MGSANGPLFHRIQRLLGRGSAENGPSKLVCAMGLLVGVLSLAFFMSDARAQQEKSVPALVQQLETVLQEARNGCSRSQAGSTQLDTASAATCTSCTTADCAAGTPPAPAPIVVPPSAPTAPAPPARPVLRYPRRRGTLAPVAPTPTLSPAPWCRRLSHPGSAPSSGCGSCSRPRECRGCCSGATE